MDSTLVMQPLVSSPHKKLMPDTIVVMHEETKSTCTQRYRSEQWDRPTMGRLNSARARQA